MRILPNLFYLRAFEAVSRHLNISKAGDELFITHSAVSQQVKALEEDLGISLIDRTGHKIRLTVAGQEYAETLISTFNKLRQASKKMRTYKDKAAIRLGVPNTLGLKCLIPKLGLFYDAHPDTQIQLLIFHDQNEPNDVDLEICYGAVKGIPSDMLLAKDQLVAIKAPKNADNLNQGARLIKVTATMRQHDWPLWLKDAKMEIDLSDAICFHETLQAIEAVENGLGIFVTHELFVKDALAHHKLCLAHPLKVKTGKAFYLKVDEAIKNTMGFQEIKNWLVNIVF